MRCILHLIIGRSSSIGTVPPRVENNNWPLDLSS
jgi:hypothetical protein